MQNKGVSQQELTQHALSLTKLHLESSSLEKLKPEGNLDGYEKGKLNVKSPQA